MVTHHYDATYFIGYPIHEMYVEQPGEEKNVTNVNVHILNTQEASD